ncbi:MAG TPA: M48 family metallopeptidase [Parachlamydiaceae bacterium]|nr:M48 family metallopeptidase [Parachlamydiaceae bacterium]
MGLFDPNYQERQQQMPPRRGFSGKWLIALLIAAVGLFMFMYQTEENPMTGEKQHVSMSPAQEVNLGLQSAPERAREMGGSVPDNDPRLKIVQKVGNLLVSKIDSPKNPWKFQFHLLADNQTVNAFALPGGQIFITLGLYNELQTEAQLAGVLGHEMGHVIERHTAQQMAKSQLGQFLVTAVATGSSDYGNGQSSPAAIASLVNHMFQLRYSRGDESAADIWGLKLLEKANFDPQAMITVMNVLKAASHGERGQEIFQTHPNPDLRIQQIEAYLKEHPPAPGLTEGARLPSYSGALREKEEMPTLFDLFNF